MTVQEDLSPKVVVAGPLSVNDVIPLDFNYINKEDIKLDNNGVALRYNIDYEVSGQSVIIRIGIEGPGPITAYRDTPFNQEAEFPQNNKFNSMKLNESLDKFCMQQQEQEEKINRSICLPIGLPAGFDPTLPVPVAGRALKVKDDLSGFKYSDYNPDDITEAVEDAMEQAHLAKDWATKMSGPVSDGQDIDYSSKYYANEAHEEAIIAGMYADQAQFGMMWTSFTISNWVLNDEDRYELALGSLPLVTSVYSGTWDTKELVCGVDIIATESGCRLVSLNAFDGFALSAASEIGNYLHEQTLASDTWVIDHNLGHIPCVILLDSDNIEMVGTIQHQSFNRCTVTFTNEVTGKAYLR